MSYLKLDGNSSEKISIIHENNKIIVRKTCTAESNRDRLKSQIEKQNSFVSFKNIKSIKYNEYTNDSSEFDIDYNSGFDFSEYFELGGIQNVKYTIDCIIQFIIFNLENSKIEDSTDTVIHKYNSVKSNIIRLFGNDYIDFLLLDNMFNSNERIHLPIGYCHGDLTLSNMIFSKNNIGGIYLIDFLESYINSPLMDIIKLRQDTYFKWSYNFLRNKNIDLTKINIIFKYFDSIINKTFSIYPEYTTNYKKLQTLNLLRLIPYSNKQLNKTTIKNIYEHINNTICW